MAAESSLAVVVGAKSVKEVSASFRELLDFCIPFLDFKHPLLKTFFELRLSQSRTVFEILEEMEFKWGYLHPLEQALFVIDMVSREKSLVQLSTAREIIRIAFNSGGLSQEEIGGFVAHLCNYAGLKNIDEKQDIAKSQLLSHIAGQLDRFEVDEFLHVEARQRLRLVNRSKPLPLWGDRLQGSLPLRGLSAPHYLKKIYNSLFIGGVVDKASIREFDRELLSAVEEYIFNRRHGNQGLGDAAGIRFFAPGIPSRPYLEPV